jgi:AAA domain/Winged helix-turn-helix DNA-binding
MVAEISANGNHASLHTSSVAADAPQDYTPEEVDRLTAAGQVLGWDDLDAEDKLERILGNPLISEWCEPAALAVLADFRPIEPVWARIRARYKEFRGNEHDLQRAVDAWRKADCAAPQPTPRLNTISARDLFKKSLPPQRFIVPGILTVGSTLFVGRGKDGKSLAMWNLCLAVALGGKVFGRYEAEQGDVLYLALEDGERRAQQRLKEQVAFMDGEEAPANLDLVLWDAPRVGAGLEEAITTWLDEHANAKLVVIDILEKVRPPRVRGGSLYADDYAAIEPLTRLAQARGIALVIVHHSNKSRPEDFRDSASGSSGLLAACDTFWSLSRVAGQPDAVLRVIGRDVDAQELAMQFHDGFWTVLGEAEAYTLSKESREILEALADAGEPLTPKRLANRLNLPVGTVRVRLLRMLERGEVINNGEGYRPGITLPGSPPELPPFVDEREPVMGVTDVTHVTGVTGVTLGQNDTELQGYPEGGVTPTDRVSLANNGAYGDCQSGITQVTGVTGVTPPTHTNGNNGTRRATDDQADNDTAEICPMCRCTNLLHLGAYRRCALCGWKGMAEEARESAGSV